MYTYEEHITCFYYFRSYSCISYFVFCLFVSFFLSFFLCSLLFWWHRAGLMLNHVERFWVIFGYLLILLAFILDLGILVLLRFGLVGLLFWSWAFQCCWVLVLLVFILDLGISVSLSFGLVGLYFGLGHFSFVEFWCIQVVFQKNVNTKQNAIFGLRCCCFWCYLLFLVFPFSSGMLHLGYAGFVSSSCWEKSSHVGLLLRPFQPMLGQCGATLVYVGIVLAMWTHVALI